ncbi:MAG: OmpH family outer membrane protein, partial [Nitrospira sp.]
GLAEAKKRELQGNFRTKVQDYQKKVQDFNQELGVKQKELVDDYMKRIQTATKSVAEKSGISLVVDKGSDQTIKIVIYNKETIELTEQVIKEFDRLNK